MKEIGGYIEFGSLINRQYHSDTLNFNSSRSALRYFIRKNHIKKIHLPYYLCGVVYKACLKENCQIIFYHINESFEPILVDYVSEDYVYIVNYYGMLSNERIIKMKEKYKNLVVDNTHSFFQKPVLNICTIYNCRKYFGVPDGAYMYSNIDTNEDLNFASVKDHIGHLIGRLEGNANQYYEEFSKNDESFNEAEVSKMSKFSNLLMGAIDYEEAKKRRKENYNYLHEKLKKYQKLNISDGLTFMYPLHIENGQELRQYLISKKIYVPKLWPDIIEHEKLTEIEQDYIENIIPLPIDHRYSQADMDIIVKYLEERLCIKQEN